MLGVRKVDDESTLEEPEKFVCRQSDRPTEELSNNTLSLTASDSFGKRDNVTVATGAWDDTDTTGFVGKERESILQHVVVNVTFVEGIRLESIGTLLYRPTV